jgi:hypothetical protein
MSYVMINRAPDGTHTRAFKSEALALAALAEMLGRSTDDCGLPLCPGRSYYSDWGNVITVEQRGPGHTAAIETRLREAFDARECGTATKRQIALLEKYGT